MTSRRLYTAKDCENCFPWILAGTTNHRVKENYLPIENPSTGTGIPNMFTIPELIHAAVFDSLASMGCFAKQKTMSAVVHYREPFVSKDGTEKIRTRGGEAKPYYVDYSFYEKRNYNVVVGIELRHDGLYGSNLPKEVIPLSPHDLEGKPYPKEKLGRFYIITYAAEFEHGKSYIDKKMQYWNSPKEAKFNRWVTAHAFIKVRPLYEIAAETLGLET